MSEKYLDSNWCHRELDWFKTQFQGRRKPPGRVFVVRAVSTSTDRWPGFLRDESGHPDIGFQFHAETTDVGIEPYGWPDLKERTREFNQPFAKLRTTLIRRLQEIKMGLPPDATTSPTPAPVAITRPRRLYLHTPPGPDNIRVQVESELRQDGYSIVTAVPRATTDRLSDWQAEVNARIQAAQRCDALTLLRATDDDAFNDEFLEVGADELSRINMGRENGPLRCAVLDKSSSPFLLADYAKQRGVELFNLNDAGWRPAFRAWLA